MINGALSSFSPSRATLRSPEQTETQPRRRFCERASKTAARYGGIMRRELLCKFQIAHACVRWRSGKSVNGNRDPFGASDSPHAVARIIL